MTDTASSGPAPQRPYCYEYPRPAVTVDVVIFTLRAGALHVLLIRRGRDPFAGRWALPGGFVEMEEALETAARRELKEETGVDGIALTQLHTFGDPGRDPRGRVISVAYYVLLDAAALQARAADDAAEVGWFPLRRLPPLAFDHDQVLACARARLRSDLAWSPLGAGLLPRTFTLVELRRLHEVILGKKLDAKKFRRQMLDRGYVKELKPAHRTEKQKSPRRYRFAASGKR
jgi:8-oxo-dGTP diphosphatase